MRYVIRERFFRLGEDSDITDGQIGRGHRLARVRDQGCQSLPTVGLHRRRHRSHAWLRWWCRLGTVRC